MSDHKIKFVATEKAPKAIGPYSQGVLAGKMLFVSGQLPIDPATSEMKTVIYDATMQCLLNILAIVEAESGTKSNLVKLNVYLKDLSDFAEMNRAYQEFFGGHKPARAAVEVSRLPKDSPIEIEAVAYLAHE